METWDKMQVKPKKFPKVIALVWIQKETFMQNEKIRVIWKIYLFYIQSYENNVHF